MDIRRLMELEKYRIEKKLSRTKTQLASCPEGNIRFDKNGPGTKWRWKKPDSPILTIPKKDIEQARALAVKKYLTDIAAAYEHQSDLIGNFLREYPRVPAYPYDLRDDCKDYRDLLSNYFQKSQLAEQWEHADYETNPEYPDRRNVPTKSGIKVRSKSEALIADALFDNRIPFRYEWGQKIGSLKVYPDFTIMHPGDMSRNVIWEHFGLVDRESYANNVKIKIGTYIDAGFILGQNLILTFESREMPLDINYVLMLIAYHFS